MILAIRIKLNPTKEQEVLFWKSAGTARWAYNYYLNANNKYYAEHKMPIKEGDVRKEINNVLKPTTHTWLSEVGSNVMKQAVKDADEARKRWLDGISAKPKFKSRHKSEPKFYVNYESLKRTKEGFRGEKLGIVKTFQPLPNINKNIQKQNKVIRNLHKRLTDVRNDHLHQSSSEIVKTKPSRIVMEHLNVKGMMKNKHLANAVAQQKLYEFKRQVKYKCRKYGIEFVEADRWFPSSKICSCCGKKKTDLKLSDRVFVCSHCDLKLDRDLNAAINLANYQIREA